MEETPITPRNFPVSDPALREVCPVVSDIHPQIGGRFSRWLGHRLLGLFGWRLRGELPNVPKAIFVGAPHTSNWDLPLALGMRMALGLDYSWMMKKEAFVFPVAGLWRKLGGVAVDRKDARDKITQMADWFNSRDRAYLGITPEGTRSKVGTFKTGYLRIAQAANIPVMVVGVDGKRKELVFDRLWETDGDIRETNEAIKSYVFQNYSGIVARRS